MSCGYVSLSTYLSADKWFQCGTGNYQGVGGHKGENLRNWVAKVYTWKSDHDLQFHSPIFVCIVRKFPSQRQYCILYDCRI